MRGALWINKDRSVQAEGTASAKALRPEHAPGSSQEAHMPCAVREPVPRR